MALDEAILALPFYEPRHAELGRRIEKWCGHRSALWDETAETAERTGTSIARALGEDGWFAYLDQEGSQDGDLRSLCVVREALAYAGDLADFAFSIQALSATPILRYGDAEQKRRHLPGMAAGTTIGSFAVSEEQAGSDMAAVGLRADLVGKEYVLNGRKAWIANGSTADLYVVIARTGEGPGPLGLTAFLVPAGTPGVRAEPVSMIAPRSFADLSFEDCRVPAGSVLGDRGGGFAIAMDLLDRFRMTVGAAAIGFARRASDAALARARSRPMYGGRLFDLQLVKATFADIEVKLNAAALLVARAAWECDRGERRYPKHSSIAKLYATEAAQEVVDASVQLFGAAGLVSESVPERLYRQVRSLRVYEGASEVQKLIIAGALDLRRANGQV